MVSHTHVKLKSRLIRLFGYLTGLHISIEWQVQIADSQGCFRVWTNGFPSMAAVKKELVRSQTKCPDDTFRIERTITISSYYDQ